MSFIYSFVCFVRKKVSLVLFEFSIDRNCLKLKKNNVNSKQFVLGEYFLILLSKKERCHSEIFH